MSGNNWADAFQPACGGGVTRGPSSRVELPSPSGRLPYPVLPVFMPFAGCPHRCVFCAQDRQTGTSGGVTEALDMLEATLAARRASGAAPCEVAFYGGTFTLLPWADQVRCLAVAGRWRAAGQVRAVRCSTRPDAVEPSLLRQLRAAGLDLLELGVQTFDDAALTTSGRGYTGARAEQACRMVRESGLKLGIQLLPGLPGGTAEGFARDVARALACDPVCLRLYPCLVIAGTPLAALWQRGTYAPWTLDETVARLGAALALAWARGVPVIRLSLAPEPALEAAVLAGPRHPALGSMIQGEALLLRMRAALPGTGAGHLRLPAYCRGFFAGHSKALLPRWRALGVVPERVEWIAGEYAQWVPDADRAALDRAALDGAGPGGGDQRS